MRIEGLRNKNLIPCPYPDCEGFANRLTENKTSIFICQNNHYFCEKCMEVVDKNLFLTKKKHLCKIKDACTNIRDLSLIDFLETSGVRVSELCSLNISDINFDERECIVYGKGRKERIVYFSSQCKVHLLKYLSTRIDDNPALFVNSISLRAQRISRGTVENLIHKISKRAGVEGAYPHRFRRTLATKLISRNVPIEQVQKLLGHSKIETTLIYAEVDQNNVKNSHRKYI
jgi:site-specific recombinase XerD